MSVDYQLFQEGIKEKLNHLAQVYRGEIQEEELDHVYEIVAALPTILRTPTSVEQNSIAQREYIEMMGNLRDSSLSTLGRYDFYQFAARQSELESKRAENRRARSEALFEQLKEYLSTENKEILDQIDADYQTFKQQLTDIVKSSLQIPEERVVGPKEVIEYINKQNRRNLT
jgi:hypothetical protein